MATIVTFHAHPDDEAIATGGVMAKYAAEGHRVVLVVATRGEVGEVPDGFLRPGEELWERRVAETNEAARLLGVARVEFLGYRDSGMIGTATNDDPACFWQADLDEAAGRLARLLTEERADVLTVYDENGAYGHPDHIQVHRVGVRAAELAGTPRVYQSTINRDHVKRMAARRDELFGEEAAGEGPGIEDLDSFGMPEAAITTVVDIRDQLAAKRAAMRAHASQIDENSWFLAMPDAAFEEMFGQEWFVRQHPAGPGREAGLLGEPA